MRLVDADVLKAEITLMFGDKTHITECICDLIDNTPTVKPCENCDLYFKAMTKEEMKAYMQQSCYTCKHKPGCSKSAVCQGCRGFNHYEKGGEE